MSATYKNSETPSREEDYRDYEAADVESGWPYRDTPSSTPDPENPPYGSPRGAVDEDANGGFRIAGVDETGAQDRLKDGKLENRAERDDADDIEERITDILATLDEVDTDSLDIHVSAHTVTIDGAVDDIAVSRRIELAVMAVDGVRQVRNRLELLGADSHMPGDGD